MSSQSTIAKKQREKAFLRAFLKLADFHATIFDEDREVPDFVVEFQGRRIGVELTELFVDDGSLIRPRARESLGRGVAERAHRRYVELGGKPVYVTIGLTLGPELLELNRTQAAEQLARFLINLDPPLDQFVTWKPAYHNDPLPPEIHYLHILAVPSWDMALWNILQSGWVAPLTESILQASIDEKHAKLSQYRLAAPETWLIIATEGWSASQLFDHFSDVRADAICTSFDRTYFMSVLDGFLLRLGPKNDA